MNKVIQKKSLRYIKLCLISPLFDVVISIVYIVTFLILSFEYFNMGNNFSNYEITQMTKEYLLEDMFKAIKTETDFINYLEQLLKTLYTFDPNVHIPIMIPLESILMVKYTGEKDKCSKLIKPVSCTSFQCTTDELGKLYQETQCSQLYHKQSTKQKTETDNPYQALISDFEGFYSKYDLFSGGTQIKLTIEEYNSDPNKYHNFIKDPDLKCKH